MNFEVAYQVLVSIMACVVILSGVLIARNVLRKLMVAIFLPSLLALGISGILYRTSLGDDTKAKTSFLLACAIFLGLGYWMVARTIVRCVARIQHFVRVEEHYLVVNEELFPDPIQVANTETEENHGQHKVRGHWRYSSSGERHWVRAHTRSNPRGHSTHEESPSEQDPPLREKVEVAWKAEGPAFNMFVTASRWFWQPVSETDAAPLREDTDFLLVLPVKGWHLVGDHHIVRLRHLECPECQQELLEWACSCGTQGLYHKHDGKWLPHPADHLKLQRDSKISRIE